MIKYKSFRKSYENELSICHCSYSELNGVDYIHYKKVYNHGRLSYEKYYKNNNSTMFVSYSNTGPVNENNVNYICMFDDETGNYGNNKLKGAPTRIHFNDDMQIIQQSFFANNEWTTFAYEI